MSFEAFKEKLQDTQSVEHEHMLKHVKGLIELSRKEMSKNYARWDKNDQEFRGERAEDKEDRNAKAKGQPSKLVVPMTQSQIMTFVSFAVMNLTQNQRFFELEPTGSEDDVLVEVCEHVLERDTRKNKWNAFLIQWFLDVARFCLASAEVCWTEETRRIRVPTTQTVNLGFDATEEQTTYEFQPITTFLGNKVYPVSPYRIFPDTRLPLTRYQEGEFMGSEDMFGLSTLKSLNAGLFNLDKVPKLTDDEMKERKKHSRIDDMATRQNPNMGGDANANEGMVKSGSVVITKITFDLVPKDFAKDVDGIEELGEEEFPVRYIVWYANDKTIVRFEEAYYLHGMFPYVLSQYLPDQHRMLNEGLSDMCAPMSDLITWLINAHMTSIRSTVEGKFVVDPAGVDLKSLESRSPYIFLKKNMAGTGVDRYIKQFEVKDPTAGFMGEAAQISDLIEKVTGLSSQMQGQYSSGRRSATQDRVVAQGAGARGKTTLSGIWDTGFESLAKQLLTNNRQEMDFETFQMVVGKVPTSVTNPETGMPYTTEELFVIFKATPQELAMSEDFFVFDGTSPSEKSFLAQSLQEVLMQMLQNPVVAQALGYGPEQFKQLFHDVYLLRGVTPARLPVPMAPTQPSALPPGALPPEAGGVPAEAQPPI